MAPRLLLCILAGVAFAAETALVVRDGDWVVVRASIQGCPDYPGVLLLHKASEVEPLQLPGLRAISILGMTEAQIVERLRDEIESRTFSRPRSLSVEILDSLEQYQHERERELASLEYLKTSDCPRTTPKRDEEDPSQRARLRKIASFRQWPGIAA